MEPTVRVAEGFSLLAGGDWIMPSPIAPLAATDEGVAGVVEAFRAATVGFVNLETNLLDPSLPDAAPRVVDDWCLTADPAVAADLASMNVRLVSRANNHSMDWGVAGLRATGRHLDTAGIVHAGVGETLADARAPRYATTSHGRVGIVSVYPTRTFDPDAALDPFGRVPGRPGANVLRLRRVVTLPQGRLATVRDVTRAIDPDGQLATPDEPLAIDDTRFEPGELGVRYDPDEDDLAQILRMVRTGAQHADLLIVTSHTHQEGADADTPPAFLQAFARACIEAGAGAFIGHGVHRLWPVELHEGRPICYGIGNAAFSDIQEPLHGAIYRFGSARLPEGTDRSRVTDADANAAAMGPYFDDDRYYGCVFVRLEMRDGKLGARVVPIDLRRGEPLTIRGVPRLAHPEQAAGIRKRLDAMSAPFGATVADDGAVLAR